MTPWLLLFSLVLAGAALAQVDDGGEVFLPDASSGEGGADRDNPEGEDSVGRAPQSCRSTSECERGFSCQDGKCNYVGFQKATGSGCQAGTPGLLALGAALFCQALTRRRLRKP